MAFSEISYPIYEMAPASINFFAKKPDPQPNSTTFLFLIKGSNVLKAKFSLNINVLFVLSTVFSNKLKPDSFFLYLKSSQPIIFFSHNFFFIFAHN